MDKTTKTNSSQSYYALMALTMTALSMSANAGNFNHGFTANVGQSAYISSASESCVLQDNPCLFPKKKNFRERYKRLSQTEWFRNTYSGKTVGEVMTVEE